MTDCERTSLYFDGELAEADEAAVLAHLAGCATCQAALGDWMGLEAALSRRRTRARARRWPWLAGAVIAAAAAAIAVLWPRAGGPAPLALAEARPVEARFTAPAFDHQRPYRVPRAGAAHELIALGTLTELERRGDTAALAAAHVLGGDLARARAALAGAPASPARDSDRAAIALAAGDPATALGFSDAAVAAAPLLAPAHWNRALALQALGLPLAAAAELDQVVARGEPGWAAEAEQRIAALRTERVARMSEMATYSAAADAMVAGTGPVITVEDVRRHPGLARRDLLDAVAVAGTPAQLAQLAPIARELDRLARNDHATRALGGVTDPAARRPFQARYRQLITGQLDAAALAAFAADLARAGDAVADLWLAVALQAPQVALDEARLARAAAADPYRAIQLARRTAQRAADAPFAAERALLAALPACHDPAWALPCGTVERELGALDLRMRRLDEAEAHLRAARAAFNTAGAFAHEDHVLTYHVSLERLRERDRVASAYLEEVSLRSPGRCDVTQFVDEQQAAIAFDRGDLATARGRLPPSDRCGVPPPAARIVLAIDLARLGDAPERDRAGSQISAARRALGAPPIAAAIGEGRLKIDDAPEAGADLVRRGLAMLGRLAGEPATAGELRAWGFATLIGDAAKRGEWAAALALFEEELGADPTGCVLAASSDNERATVVVRGPGGELRGSYETDHGVVLDAATIVPPGIAAGLAGCPRIAVIARPPLHGSDALLPPGLPWAFVGRPTPPPAPAAPARAVVVSDARPPAALALPALAPVQVAGAAQLTGADATPARVLDALHDATYVELHAHGIVDASDAAFVALSPDGEGRFALTVAEVRGAHLEGAPVVVLAACHGARGAARNRATRWSLPDAFLAAGARAVIAASTEIPDDQGTALFGELRDRLARGEPPAHAVAALRAARVAAGQAWAAGLMVFE